MLNTSSEFKKEIRKNSFCKSKANVIFRDGTSATIESKSIRSISFEEATSAAESFEIGGAVIGKLSLTLENWEETYSEYDFEKAQITLSIGKEISDGTTEWLKRGTYNSSNPTEKSTTITIEALDNMSKFDRKYDSNLSYPATIRQIVQDACSACGVTLATKSWDNDDYIVESRPDDDAVTYREIIAWAAQICCKYAKCDPDGCLVLDWYGKKLEYVLVDTADESLLLADGSEVLLYAEPSPEEILNGEVASTSTAAESEILTTTEDEHILDTEGNQIAVLSGGITLDGLPYYHEIDGQYSLTVGTSDTVITGAAVEYDDTIYLSGKEDYALQLSGNELIQSVDKAKKIARFLNSRLNGFRFRTFSGKVQGDPSMEAGDCVVIIDRKGKKYLSYITNSTYTVGGSQSISCGAESQEEKQSERFSTVTKILSLAQKDTEKQISTYNQAVQSMVGMLANSLGAFSTEVVQDDGSVIHYMHDKPKLEESQTIWKKTIDAFAVSTDGGETWNAGVDRNGNVIVNVLAAIGISCDWLKGGTAVFGGENNVNGSVKVLDSDGNTVVTLDNKGADIVGKVTSRNAENGSSTVIDDGEVILTNRNGKTIARLFLMDIIDIASGTSRKVATLYGSGSNPAYIKLDGETGDISFNGNSLSVGSTAAKSGKAEFSDGSYLTFSKGLLTGGMTSGGTTF